MGDVIISDKYKIVIQREIRKQLGIKTSQKLKVVVKGRGINLVPKVPLSELKGFLKGMDTSGIREHEERL
ncbi:AbrB/MazE/SpoVT family DNA-binding domain-containing protein [Desulfotruncus alcoholivorax]|uniref:AbrB/MazE/SpoVT family DNA-binding domain-containing protein n=1 Tax=Desulfotruncus alcoholivorax TaxID=265477 RepID=UPI0004051564|nr:AbrB/MazE/SpoVT family DNA-binding domain-containing protein [Desulfotruncus alcoholivorax]